MVKKMVKFTIPRISRNGKKNGNFWKIYHFFYHSQISKNLFMGISFSMVFFLGKEIFSMEKKFLLKDFFNKNFLFGEKNGKENGKKNGKITI